MADQLGAVRQEIRWLMGQTKLAGLRMDGSLMSWDQALDLYGLNLRDWLRENAAENIPDRFINAE